jgi:hypothetical protein
VTEQPGYRAEHLLRGLSLPRRIGYVVAGLGGLAGATMIVMLLATEPAPLPARTRIAFAFLAAIGIAWFAFAAWALARRPMFAADRVIAATLAVVFSGLTTVGAVAIASARSSMPGAAAAAGVGLTLTVVAVVLLVRARRYRAGLLAREHGLSGTSHESGLPIGPLALAMRHRRRHVAVAAVILGLALVAGVALLLR